MYVGKGREGCGCKREREGGREKIREGGEGKELAGSASVAKNRNETRPGGEKAGRRLPESSSSSSSSSSPLPRLDLVDDCAGGSL